VLGVDAGAFDEVGQGVPAGIGLDELSRLNALLEWFVWFRLPIHGWSGPLHWGRVWQGGP
jgi:hypothetical protein